MLAESPKSAPACDYIRQGYRRRSVVRHMIYFRITDYGIAIIRVLHE
jgi:toxin ParE1/3/4